MHMTSSVLVKSDLETAWALLSNERNAARWDRSVARADLMSPPPLRVGSIVQTTAPSGMTQDFRVDEFSPPHVLRFSLVRSQWFRTAQLSFTWQPTKVECASPTRSPLRFDSDEPFSFLCLPSPTGVPSLRIWTH